MFNIGGGELLVILLLALIVLGPQRLPDAARQIGKFMGEVRRMSSGFQQEMKAALREPTNAYKPVVGDAPATPPVTTDVPPTTEPAAGSSTNGPSINGSTPKPAPKKKAAARKRAAPLKAPAKGKPGKPGKPSAP